jgi:hypothetical protein
MRIAYVEEAAKRSRWVFAASIIASIAILGTAWNSAPFGLYEFASDMWDSGFAENVPTSELQKALLKAWVESLFVSIPLFGIRFSVNDIWFLGTAALFIVAIWEFYGARRENHLIGSLFRDVACEDERTRTYVFYGVCGTQVFATLTDDDLPLTSIEHKAPLQIPGLRPVLWLLSYLPAVVIFAAVAADLATVFWWGAPFRTDHKSLLAYASSKGTNKVTQLLIEVALEDGAAVCFGIITAALLWRSMQFQMGTIRLIRKAAADGWGNINPGPQAQPI